MTHPIDTTPEAIAALLDGVTPGPWGWQVSRVSKSVELSGGRQSKAGGDLTVMSFERWGFNSAAPVFWTWEGNYATSVDRADALAVSEEGREHHKDWFARIDHPDARFIAAARDLVPALAAEIARLTAERDEARAQAAVAYEAAANLVLGLPLTDGVADVLAEDIAAEIRALTPADAAAALSARDAAMRNEGRRQVKVKPLVWKESGLRNDIALAYAMGSHGHCYEVMRDGAWFRLTVAGKRIGGAMASLEDAKSAGNEHNAARILAALEPEGGE